MQTIQELNCYSGSLYSEARRLSKFRNGVLSLEVILLVVSMFSDGASLYGILLAIVVSHIFAEFCKYLVQKNNKLAHQMQINSMLIDAYDEMPDDKSLAYLKSNVSPEISEDCLKNIKDTTENNNNENFISKDKKLFSKIQENAFWNYHLYEDMYYSTIKSLVILVGIIVLILFAVPLLDNQFQFAPLNIILIFLSFSILYELIETALNYNSASKEMFAIDNALSQTSSERYPGGFGFDIFTKYIIVRKTCPYISDNIYKRKQKLLNNNWKKRDNKI